MNSLGKISSLIVTSDNKYIVSGSDDFTIKIFDLETKQQIHHLQDLEGKKGDVSHPQLLN